MARIDLQRALTEHQRALASVTQSSQKIENLIARIIQAFEAGGKVLWMGNGGSAADAQHMAAEMMVRYVKDRRPLPAMALNTDTSILTAHSNDYHFETVFARQIEGLARREDVVMALSTSGHSANVVRGMEAAIEKGCYCVALTGQADSPLSRMAHCVFQVDSHETARIQEAHTFISHLICEGLDTHFA
jgi:D-sedoheptulose 7-phosphate isomerase